MEPYHPVNEDIREEARDPKAATPSYVMLGIIALGIVCLLIFLTPLVARTWLCYCCNRRVRRYPFESEYHASRRRANIGLRKHEIQRIPTFLYCSQSASMNPLPCPEVNENGEDAAREYATIIHGVGTPVDVEDPIAQRSHGKDRVEGSNIHRFDAGDAATHTARTNTNLDLATPQQTRAEPSRIHIMNRYGGECAAHRACKNGGLAKSQNVSTIYGTNHDAAHRPSPDNERKLRQGRVNEDATTQVGTVDGGDATTQTVITGNGRDVLAQTAITANGVGDATRQTVITVNGGGDAATARTTSTEVGDAEDASTGTTSRTRIVTCAICLVDFENGNMIRILPRCMHAFHVPCIDSWLSKHSTCPTCRSDLLVAVAEKTSNPSNFQMLLVEPNRIRSNP